MAKILMFVILVLMLFSCNSNEDTQRAKVIEKEKKELALIKGNNDFGYIFLDSKPELYIKIDGKELLTKTPIAKFKIPVGNHRIGLYDESIGINDSFNIKVKKGKTEFITREFIKKETIKDENLEADSIEKSDVDEEIWAILNTPTRKEILENEKNEKIEKSHGYISIITNPPLYVKINGWELKQKTPLVKLKIFAREYRVTLYDKIKNIKDILKIKVEVGKVKQIVRTYTGDRIKDKLMNEKSRSYGYLSIISSPSLYIKVDGVDLKKKTPLIKFEMPTGNYRITLFNRLKNIKEIFTIRISKEKITKIIKKY